MRSAFNSGFTFFGPFPEEKRLMATWDKFVADNIHELVDGVDHNQKMGTEQHTISIHLRNGTPELKENVEKLKKEVQDLGLRVDGLFNSKGSSMIYIKSEPASHFRVSAVLEHLSKSFRTAQAAYKKVLKEEVDKQVATRTPLIRDLGNIVDEYLGLTKRK